MPTEKQIAAARANGAKSRGPVTPEGKRNSSRNSLRHGMLARTVVLDNESRDRFNELFKSLRDELQPETAIEDLLIQKMAVAHWRQMRLWTMEKASIAQEADKAEAARSDMDESATDSDPCTRDALAFRSPGGSLMSQFEMRYDRQFSRALENFQKYREKRMGSLLTETNPSNAGNESPSSPDPNPT